MEIFTDAQGHLQSLQALLGDGVDAGELPQIIATLSDEQVVEAIRTSTALIRCVERLRVVATGVAAERSTHQAGHGGLAQARGHRTAVALIQQIAGSTKADAVRQVRVGEALVGAPGKHPAEEAPKGSKPQDAVWHAPLDRALLDGRIATAQHDAIRRGLGEPESAAVPAWMLAVEQLITAAEHETPEMLGAAARTIRDRLDPEGASRRFDERFERRSFRLWTDAEGGHHGRFDFDDEAFVWVNTIISSALRPRRGGPRFVDTAEQAAAADLSADPRTNDQLSYDLMIDVLRAGALADAESVFGTRQAGVRLVQIVDSAGSPQGPTHTEDDLIALPSEVATQRICTTGAVSVTVDACGNPLDVGREHRLFTPRQRIALAIRDGGCRWNGCDRPASYCEAHHIDEWTAHGGRTDIDRGVLLCRFHHMQLHHGRHRITRQGRGEFFLRSSDGRTRPLVPRLALTYAWAGIDPPPKRFRAAA